MKPRSIYVGFDPREAAAFAVAVQSIRQHATRDIPIRGVVLDQLRASGLYRRPTEKQFTRLYDVRSRREDYNGAISTEFAIARFLAPHLAQQEFGGGLAMFLDCDMLARTDFNQAFDYCAANAGKAVYCVKHNHDPAHAEKMDGQLQTRYARKNWSSFAIYDCDHVANKALTLDLINNAPGRDLHAYCWLADEDIGALPPGWNWLAGHDRSPNPQCVHHTEGSPCMEQFRDAPYADEWRAALHQWAARP